MKKGVIFILSCFIVFASFINVKAVDDVEAPTLKSISIDKKSLYGGENLTFRIVGDDDFSGLENVMIEYELSTNSSKKLSIEFTNPSSSNTFSKSYKIPEKTVPGTWNLSAVQLWDKSGKWNLYYPSTDPSVNFSNCQFKLLENKKFDTTPPVFQDAFISTKSVSAPGQFDITIKATDNVTSRLEIQVAYDMGDEQWGFNPQYVSANTYKATIKVTESAKYKPIKLVHIILIDAAKNQTWVVYNPNDFTHQDSVIKLNKNLDVSVKNSVSDKKPPVLKGFSYSSNEISAPGSMSIFFDAIDDVSGISKVNAYFKGYDKNEKMIVNCIVTAYPPMKNGKYTADYIFNQYYPDSTFYIDAIEVFDKAGNKSKYSIYGVDGDIKIDKKEFKLKKAIVSDVSTGTMKDDYLQTIQSSKDNAVITLDCSKNSTVDSKAFTNIKGTNKTLILVNDGIQWIFKGKDIKNPVKKINTNVNIYAFDEFNNKTLIECFTDNTKGMVIEFAPNGLLPGKILIRIKADYTFRNYIGENDLFIYHYIDDDKGLEAIAEQINITKDGYYEFYITHNSKYIISKQRASSKSVIKNSIKELENPIANDGNKTNTDSIVDVKNENSLNEKTDESSQNNVFFYVFIAFCCVTITYGIIYREKIVMKFKKNK